MLKNIYIETTIASYYFDDRVSIRADIQRTREWWDTERRQYSCATSIITLEELQRGRLQLRIKRAQLLENLPLLPVSEAVIDLAEVYCRELVMPKAPSADALHMALASVYGMDALLTWNCKHLANENKAERIAKINSRYGYPIPQLLTPHQLRLSEDEK